MKWLPLHTPEGGGPFAGLKCSSCPRCGAVRARSTGHGRRARCSAGTAPIGWSRSIPRWISSGRTGRVSPRFRPVAQGISYSDRLGGSWPGVATPIFGPITTSSHTDGRMRTLYVAIDVESGALAFNFGIGRVLRQGNRCLDHQDDLRDSHRLTCALISMEHQK